MATVYRHHRDCRNDSTLDLSQTPYTSRCTSRRNDATHNRPPNIHTQSVKSADTVSATTRVYDALKKINARNRHIVFYTIGLLLKEMITAASIQDRDGGRGNL